jgi:hypothetical protein
MIVINGEIVAQGSQFSLNDVEVVTATVDIEDVRTYRCSVSRGMQASKQSPYVRLDLDTRLSRRGEDADPALIISKPIKPRYHAPEEEIALGPACWLWDYLRRCGAAGFFIPLSGGIDSCATSVIVHSMCREVMKAVRQGNEPVIKDVRRLCASQLTRIGFPPAAKRLQRPSSIRAIWVLRIPALRQETARRDLPRTLAPTMWISTSIPW